MAQPILTSKDLKDIGLSYTIAMGVELVRQGREKKAGGLINSLEPRGILPNVIQIWGNHYWRFVNNGVAAASIKSPFAPARINALVKWLKQKGIGSSDKKIRGIAYAIAYTHSKKGMPTRGGSRDSKRLNFLENSINKSRGKIEATISNILGKRIDTLVQKF
jgi:hypothetical protein